MSPLLCQVCVQAAGKVLVLLAGKHQDMPRDFLEGNDGFGVVAVVRSDRKDVENGIFLQLQWEKKHSFEDGILKTELLNDHILLRYILLTT